MTRDDRAEVHAAKAAYLLRRRALDLIGAALSSVEVVGLLVKGAGLAETVYAEPWSRAMSDVDLVVPAEVQRVCLDAFEALGHEVVPIPDNRRRSYEAHGERMVRVAVGPARVAVELHATLDKLVLHPIDWPGILARSSAISGLSESLRVPCVEDHALLVMLHAALSELRHERAWDDLERLVERGLDRNLLVERGRAWGLAPTMALVLDALEARRPTSAAAALRRELRGALPERPLARRLFERAAVARHKGTGLTWVVRQAMLRDDPLRYALGVLRFAGLRVADKLPW
ncbi:MAG: nucleotidyltransferase family protein [Deltaproteobacteria bacterium]|nr:nucleotidyltransferase family protein [Deltaproteobacteria bacterium]